MREKETLVAGEYTKISISTQSDIDMVWWHIESMVDDEEEIMLRDQDFADLKKCVEALDTPHFKMKLLELSRRKYK